MAAWLQPLYTADEMRVLDAWATAERGVPSLDLMEQAGAGVARAVHDLGAGGPVRVVCGKGNNAGDGLVVVRKLGELDMPAEALLLWSPAELSDDARVNHEKLVSGGGEARQLTPDDLPAALAGSGVVVDAMLGTGFSGAPRAPLDAAIEALNSSRCPVVAVDVPSGVDASTGEVGGACVRADVTVTFHAHKIGLWVLPGKQHAGRVHVVDIGIPTAAGPGPAAGSGAGLIAPSVLEIIPRRGIDSNKFSSGSVLVVGGSTGLTGAVCMASNAAARAGAGWVRAAVPHSLNPIFEQKLTEVMTLPLIDSDGYFLPKAIEQLLVAAERADAVVLGPGLGRAEEPFEVARAALRDLGCPVLVDADGLGAIARAGLETVAARGAPTILTPHAGELARLLGTESHHVSAHRLEHAREAASRSGATVVLKGDDSLVVEPGGAHVGVSTVGSPALATAGTGDVLAGVIAAFVAKGLGSFEAACAGVYVHGRAGCVAGEQHGVDSVVATDVIEALSQALSLPGEGEAGGGDCRGVRGPHD